MTATPLRPELHEITPAQTRVLLAVAVVYKQRGRVTVREVCRLTGRSENTVHRHLRRLRTAGFVTWTEGERGSMRPLVEIVACNP